MKNLNIFSQCENNIQDIAFQYLMDVPVKKAFKLGTQLSYTSFHHDRLMHFFDNLYQQKPELFFLFSSGFISNPQQNKPLLIFYLIKKTNFIHLNKKLNYKNIDKHKIIKI